MTITIPPEALEAAARALAVENETREDWWRFYEGKARAACLALINNWPGMRQSRLGSDGDPRIILPITQENQNDKG